MNQQRANQQLFPSPTPLKYPSRLYLPYSPGANRDVIDTMLLIGKPLVVTVKMDGSNCSLTRERVAARNGKYAFHKSFDLIKARHSALKHRIPMHLQLFGEWLYAKHSIHYTDLDDYFQMFEVYDMSKQLWLGWDEVEAVAASLDLITVPVLGRFQFATEQALKDQLTEMAEDVIAAGQEGIVVRNVDPFPHCRFSDNAAKYVRAGHVQTDEHWMTQPLVRNELKWPAQKDYHLL